MSPRPRRTTGKIITDKGPVYVNSPELADFLQTLTSASGGGVLLEDLTCTVDNGVGGVSFEQTFLAGDTIENVLRAILTAPSNLGLSNFKLLDGSTSLSGSTINPVGEEVEVDGISYTIADTAVPPVITADSATFSITGTSEGMGDLPTGDGDQTIDFLSTGTILGTNDVQTFGRSDSNNVYDYSNSYKNYNFTLTADSPDVLSASTDLQFALPAVLLNVTTVVQSDGTDTFNWFATGGFYELGLYGVMASEISSRVDVYKGQANYSGFEWSQSDNYDTSVSNKHIWLFPAGPNTNVTATPTVTQGGATFTADAIQETGLVDLRVARYTFATPGDEGLQLAPGESDPTLVSPYRYFVWKNVNAFSGTPGITFTF